MSVGQELNFTRSIGPRDKISRFFRSQSKWELLLLVASNKGNEELGIWNYIDMLATRTESQMTMYNFIKDRIEDGSFVLLPSPKKSRKALDLSPELEAALNKYLSERYVTSNVTEEFESRSMDRPSHHLPQQ
ncbi:MAG: hypothetical protein RJA58_177 [Pseudomonadota bacterium]